MATEQEIQEGIRMFQEELNRTAPQIDLDKIASEVLPAPNVTPLNVYSIKDAILAAPFNQERIAKGELSLVPHSDADDNLAIIEGPKGVLVYCTEGVGWRKKSLDDEFAIDLHPNDEEWQTDAEGKKFKPLWIMPTHTIKMTLAEIKEKGVLRHVEAKDFVRVHNGRLESNFRLMLGAIDKIGLNQGDYYKGRRPNYSW